MTTRTSMPRTHSRSSDGAPIVVGVDPAGRSTSAVLWAAEEAERTGRALHLISAYPAESATAGDQASLRSDLAGVARRLTLSDLEYDARFGPAVGVLLDAVADGSLLVVGRRGYGGVQRRLVGSTSMAVSSRSPVPVVVAPERWLQPSRSSAPLVVGIDRRHRSEKAEAGRRDADREALEFAFDRAGQLRVPLIVVHAFEMPMFDSWSSHDVEARRGRHQEDVEARLAPWRQAYPDVEVAPRCVPGPPRQALVDAARVAQLTVLGRHSGGHLRGTMLGSTARGFLHQTEHPVALVPVPAAENQEDVDDAGS